MSTEDIKERLDRIAWYILNDDWGISEEAWFDLSELLLEYKLDYIVRQVDSVDGRYFIKGE